MFSIFEEHTEWISKGRAGVPQELGLRVCILEDQYGFILHHHVMEKQTDDKIAVQEEFVNLRRKHSAVESGINAFENHGLDRCLDHGIEGFKRHISLSVLARNIQILGSIIQKKKLKQQKRKKEEDKLPIAA